MTLAVKRSIPRAAMLQCTPLRMATMLFSACTCDKCDKTRRVRTGTL
ncbi:hypothetical protein [Xanthomonas vesicatoria]|uniref:Uncharacterized protein n=1 Tax=Xanthomonas vesicatoria TaxID=56460 RepID=A0ABS8LBA5_9XANT|nr:hypothetical protein [Xanthomonas vesicatoria]MCC8603500.1 hypothetical protein [Xanthomonas vesicatoria]MCC8617456.1 hypothetical protein [Xanthomonas vesicatoria]MCC8623035.1 hypothetical protein [Xanthomonas vesicatoria]MCC8629922.1 hypothetical protein [Xanthomonas vesicatoria]MCC8694475.1 hypothetical protein [Xanthomonas vesicatoria]